MPPNADDPLRTTDHAPAPEEESRSDSLATDAPPGRAASPCDGTAPEARLGPLPVVAGYEVLGVLGRGGMGVVFKARHLALKRAVALKMILAGGHATESERARFHAEAEAVARLQHPGIVQIHEVGEHDGLPFCA